MKQTVIKNFNSLPASFIEVSPEGNNLYSKAKLKVFYVGETADGRLFTKKFAEKLMKTIRYAPVVSHYNEETNDFEGHAEEQAIYGLVDPLTEPVLEKSDDGNTWAICDVILYTGRADSVGAISSKIVGHAQSLEMNPDTLKYKINRDRNGEFKNMEFLDGEFVGVSVLGKEQEPAFTGSGFFDLNNPDFAHIKEIFEEKRGEKMNLNIPNFVEQSWGEKFGFVSKALCDKYGDKFLWIVDMYDDYAIAMIYNTDKEDCEMHKVAYTVNDNGEATLGAEILVHPSYEELPENSAAKIDQTNENMETKVVKENEKPNCETTSTDSNANAETDSSEDTKKKCGEATETTNDADAKKKCGEAECPDPEDPDEKDKKDEDDEDPDCKKKEKCEVENDKEKENCSNDATLSDAERQELEAYRRAAKETLISKYTDTISAEELDSVKKDIDSYDYQSLKNLLNEKFVEKSFELNEKQKTGSKIKWFADIQDKNVEDKDNDVASYLRKKKEVQK